MKVEKISLEKQRSRRWSGGVAVDVFCYPQGSTYEDWNFEVNVSTAVCEDLDSVFTHMEDTKRYLMIFNGIMQITHPNRYTRCLMPYECETFMGDWDTISKGKCNDFNLLCRGGWDGAMLHGVLCSDERRELKADATMLGFFPVDAPLTVRAGDEETTAGPRELIWLTPERAGESFTIQTAQQPTNYVKISVTKPEEAK